MDRKTAHRLKSTDEIVWFSSLSFRKDEDESNRALSRFPPPPVMTLRSISNMTTKCSHCIEHGSWINLKSAFSQEKLNFFFSLTTCERESIETTPQNLITNNQNSSLLIQFHYCAAGLALFTSKSVLLNKYRFLDEGKFSAETFKLPVLGLNSIFHKKSKKKRRNSSTSRCAVRVFLLFFARAKKNYTN